MLIDNSKYPILNFVLNGRIHVPEIDACSFYAEAASTQNRINEVHSLKTLIPQHILLEINLKH